ncbi:MAG: hypothetical protein JXA54_04125 [Candidatus Heimdallarchaeota archaeon]|nr:hypothetical protein [Candidatus Heimdallarchaeota archaeon]
MTPKSRKQKRKRISSGTVQNLNTIITELSIIIGRKSWPKEDPTKAVNDAFKNTDSHLAAIGLVLPDIDINWRESGARNVFLKLKKRRQILVRTIIAIFIVFSLGLLAGAIATVFLWDHWAQWVILLAAAAVLFIGSTLISRYVMGPFIAKRDEAIPSKYPNECKIIDKFIDDLVQVRRK